MNTNGRVMSVTQVATACGQGHPAQVYYFLLHEMTAEEGREHGVYKIGGSWVIPSKAVSFINDNLYRGAPRSRGTGGRPRKVETETRTKTTDWHDQPVPTDVQADFGPLWEVPVALQRKVEKAARVFGVSEADIIARALELFFADLNS